MMKRKADWTPFDVCNAALMVLLMVVMIYPFYYVAIVSLSDGKAVMTGKVTFWPANATLDSYKLIFRDNEILVSYWNTIRYTFVGTLINLVMTTLAAYPLSRPRLVGKRFFMMLAMFTMFFSGGIIPMYLQVFRLGLIDTIWAVVLPGAISTYNLIVMRTFFSGIPNSLHESAHIDGANDLQILLRVVLPLSTPILATMTLFYAVGHWNSFFNALLYLNKREMYPLQILLRNMAIMNDSSRFVNETGAASGFLTIEETIRYAVIMAATLPILLVYPFLQKYFVKGVMIGSLKG